MRIDIATLFPGMCDSVLSESIIGRARKAGGIEIVCHNIRDFTQDKHRRVDDSPYGGGKGMIMQCEPIFNCFAHVCSLTDKKPHTIFMSARGTPLNQKRALELSLMGHILIICGHYEGVDQRVIDEIADEEISIGDYVITGGELAALVLADCVVRLCDGVLPEKLCYTDESHFSNLLEYPQYTRPPIWNGRNVPEVLISGHHANIEGWKRKKSLEDTLLRRPELLKKAVLSKKEEAYLNDLRNT